MEPTVVDKPQMLLVGLSFFGDPFRSSAGWTEENEIGRTWKRFEAYLSKHRERIRHVSDETVCYELHVYHEETPQTGEFEVFVGLEVDRLESVPLDLTVKLLPDGRYSRFTLRGQEIVSDWHMKVFNEWLPAAGYEGLHTHSYQRYDSRFKGLEQLADSVLEVFIPVKS